MKVKDLIKRDIDIDVYDNVCEELCIAFCGAQELTEEGEEYFAEVLEYTIEECDEENCVCIVDVDGDDFKHKLKKAKEFFYAMAGYCSLEDWDKWFKE